MTRAKDRKLAKVVNAERRRVTTYPSEPEPCGFFREYPYCIADAKAKGGIPVFRASPALAARVLRERGFPLYDLSLAEKRKTLAELLRRRRPIRRGVVSQETRFNPLASCYFPHMWTVRAGKRRTPQELFEGEDLARALAKRGKLRERTQYELDEEQGLPKLFGQYLTPATLDPASVRKALRIYSGTQGVSNFSPVAASAIYHHLLPKEGGVVWDPSCGWGGRLAGAIACDKVHKYVGCDPSSETYRGLLKMRDELLPMAQSMGRNLEIELHMLGSETEELRAALPKGGVDLVFSSPPYFGQEEYSRESTQSFIQFPTPEAWLNGFMRMTLDNCAYCLKADGTLAINIADVSDYPGNLEDDFVALAESQGWKLVKKMKLALSIMPGTRRMQKGTHKYEPIHVFRRKP